MVQRRVAVLLLLVLMCLVSVGCPKDPYRASLQASDDVANAVHSALVVTTDYYGMGKLTDSEKALIGKYLNDVTDANMNFRHSIVQAHLQGVVGKAVYLQLAQAFVNAVPTDPLAFQYKSSDAQQKFNIVLGVVKTGINGISLVVTNAKGGQ